LLIAIAVQVLSKKNAFPGGWALLPVIGAALLIGAGPDAWVNRKLLANRGMVFVGLISYPLYLWHWPLLSFVRILEGRDPARGIIWAALALSFGLSWLTYRLIERPLRVGDFKFTAHVLCGLMVCVGLVGYRILRADGYPSRMPPIIAEAKSLRNSQMTNPECEALFGPGARRFVYCRSSRVGGVGRETVAIIGDSHANALFPGFAKEWNDRGKHVLLLGNSGCPVLRGALTGESPEQWNQCHAQIEQILKFVSSRRDIRDVFLVTRGPIYIEGTSLNPMRRNFDFSLRALDPALKNASPAELFRVGLTGTVRYLQHAGKRVYYLIENPELEGNPKHCVARPFYLTTRPECAPTRAKVLARQAEYRRLVASVEGLAVLDSLDFLCPDRMCLFVDDGRLLYVDDDHLSREGSLRVSSYLMKAYFP